MGRPFWLLIVAVLVNQLGTMVGPFLPLYLRRERGLDEATTSALLAAGSAASVLAGAVGGLCSDRFGRRACLVVGFLTAGASMALLPGAPSLAAVGVLVVSRAFAAAFVRPSNSAAIGDVVPRALQRRAFGVFRTAMNLGFGVGTFTGGLLAARGFVDLFVVNASTAAAAAVMALLLPETRPGRPGSAAAEPGPPAADDAPGGAPDGAAPGPDGAARVSGARFACFCGLALTVSLVSGQLTTTLPLSLERRAGAGVEGLYGALLALNGAIVCLTQLLLSRAVERARATSALAVGAVLYGLGYGAVGLSVDPVPLGLAVATLTAGEMLFFPMASAWVASVTPPARRGRWFGALSMSYGLGSVLTPLVGTWVLQRAGDGALWALSPPIGLLAAAGFVALGRGAGDARPAPGPA